MTLLITIACGGGGFENLVSKIMGIHQDFIDKAESVETVEAVRSVLTETRANIEKIRTDVETMARELSQKSPQERMKMYNSLGDKLKAAVELENSVADKISEWMDEYESEGDLIAQLSEFEKLVSGLKLK